MKGTVKSPVMGRGTGSVTRMGKGSMPGMGKEIWMGMKMISEMVFEAETGSSCSFSR